MLSSAISYALSKEKKGREWGEFISVCACVCVCVRGGHLVFLELRSDGRCGASVLMQRDINPNPSERETAWRASVPRDWWHASVCLPILFPG